MTDSSEWELSKENVQPLREGRRIAALTSALQRPPTDHLKEQRNLFEQQLRMYEGDDPLEIWDSYIKWTEQNFPRGGKDGKMVELLQRCVTHFQGHEGYKNDSRFVHIWIKFAGFSDEPVEIYQYMFDQKIGCDLAVLYEEWARFVECLGNTRKADSIYIEGINRGAQPLNTLKTKHSEFQMRVARDLLLQPRGEEEEEAAQMVEEQRTVLGGLRPDKNSRVGTTRTGTAKLGTGFAMRGSAPAAKQVPGPGVQVFQDENASVVSIPQQTGEKRALPVREVINSENEQAPGVWTKARVSQRRAVTAAAAAPAKLTVHVHEDENAGQEQQTVSVDSHVLRTRKNEKPGHLLDPVRNSDSSSRNERPMYCKEKVYTGTQEFSFEELRALKYIAKKKKQQDEEEKRRLEEQLREMRLIHSQFQMDMESMRNERQQLLEMRRQMQLSQDSSGVQPSPMSLSSVQSTPVVGAPVPSAAAATGSSVVLSAPSSASFSGGVLSAPSSASFSGGVPPAPSSASFSGGVPPAPSSASFSGGVPSAPSSASFTHPTLSSASSFNSSLQRQGMGSNNASLNASQRTPGSNPPVVDTSSGSGGRQSRHPSAGCTPDANSSKQSLSRASPTINMKEALLMVQGMYNTSLACDKPENYTEDTEMTEAVPPQAPQLAPIVVFHDNAPNTAKPPPVAIFCDENAPPQENRAAPSKSQKIGSLGFGRMPLKERAMVPSPCSEPQPPQPVTQQFSTEDTAMVDDGIEARQQYDMTLAALGSQDSFAAAARAASTPFGASRGNSNQLPSPPLSSIKPPKPDQMCYEVNEAGIGQTTSSEDTHCQTAPYTTLNHTAATVKYLSPIIEGGSSEGSLEELQSQAGSTLGATTSTLKTPAPPRHAAATAAPIHEEPMEHSDQHHVIDTSHYVPAEATEALLSMSVCIDPHNPFDEATIKGFLKRLSPPLSQRHGYFLCNQLIPSFNEHSFISLGQDTYQVNQLIGEGGYAKVYHAEFFFDPSDDSMDNSCNNFSVIKVQKPAAPWEFYICSELHKRIHTKGLHYMSPCMMEITHGYFYQDGSCLVSEYCQHGSLLSLVNKLKLNKNLMANLEPLAAYLTIHLLRVVEVLHSCGIIHGDLKPDNILITNVPEVQSGMDKKAYFGPGTQCLRLVDFGQAIDMTLYPPGTTFMAKVATSGFQCIEMMTNRPWTYQADLFGVAGSVHVLVFGQYMKVYCSQGKWHMTSSFQRKWNVEIWKKLFHQLLNIEDCEQLPDLVSIRRELEDHFLTNLAPQLRTLLVKVKGSI